jgi:hypothetical protein
MEDCTRLSCDPQVCYHCLTVLGDGAGTLAVGRSFRFCSGSCLEAAGQTYLEVEEQTPLMSL